MSPGDLRRYQRALGLSDRGFAEFICANVRTVRRWKKGELDMPGWLVRFLPAIVAFETDDKASPAVLRGLVRAQWWVAQEGLLLGEPGAETVGSEDAR